MKTLLTSEANGVSGSLAEQPLISPRFFSTSSSAVTQMSCVVFGNHIRQCSGFMSASAQGSLLANLENHIKCWGLNPNGLHARQNPLLAPYLFGPHHKVLIKNYVQQDFIVFENKTHCWCLHLLYPVIV